MVHEISKQLLEKATTFELRQKAVRAAMALGMPLHEIETHLDWLDSRARKPNGVKRPHLPNAKPCDADNSPSNNP